MTDDPYEKMKETDGAFAWLAWLGSCLYLFIFDGTHGSLLSFKGLVFIVGGSFFAATVFGVFFHYFKRFLSRYVFRFAAPNLGVAAFVSIFGLAIALFEVFVIYSVASWGYQNSSIIDVERVGW